MKHLEFRKLRADEIECRIGSVFKNGKGFTLLLYKDARVDQNLLDETVGAYNWQRTHSRDNRNCTVSIWDEDKKQWISKEDTGTESNTEAGKGLASDSFKRACFNWGCGRELYTAPRITIFDADKYDRFEVTDIGYDKSGNINRLKIFNATKGEIAFTFPKDGKAPKRAEAPEPAMKMSPYPSRDEMITVCDQYYKGDNRARMLAWCKASNIKDLADAQLMTAYNVAMRGSQ